MNRTFGNVDENWKFTPHDISERALWDIYQNYYEEAINNTSLPYALWYIIPADDKHTARCLVAKIIYEKMVKYDYITEPLPDANLLKNIDIYKEMLSKESIYKIINMTNGTLIITPLHSMGPGTNCRKRHQPNRLKHKSK